MKKKTKKIRNSINVRISKSKQKKATLYKRKISTHICIFIVDFSKTIFITKLNIEKVEIHKQRKEKTSI